MRKLTAPFVLALAVAAPAMAATRNCTAGLVTAGVCRLSTNKLISYDLPASPAGELADAFASLGGCVEATATTCIAACTQNLVNSGVCTAGQLGTSVTITKAAFADASIRLFLITTVRQYREQQAVEPVRATARATTDPDVSN